MGGEGIWGLGLFFGFAVVFGFFYFFGILVLEVSVKLKFSVAEIEFLN